MLNVSADTNIKLHGHPLSICGGVDGEQTHCFHVSEIGKLFRKRVSLEWLFCKLQCNQPRQQEDKKRQQELQLLTGFSINSDEI
jgi:hypothetical protein